MNDLSVSVSNSSVAHQAPRPEASAKVTARNLNFYYGEHHALKNINLSLGTNRVTAFIGPSGCGKSTLLRIFNRMYDLYPGQRAVGQLMLDNMNILDPKLDLNLLRARVGMVFQKPTPFPMTIYENIAFGIRLYEKISKSEMDGRVEKALRGGGMTHGNRQVVHFALLSAPRMRAPMFRASTVRVMRSAPLQASSFQ